MKHTHHRRAAFTLTELMVCASLLATVMSFVATISIRTDRLWRDTRNQKIALDELGNQLEHLTTLDLPGAQQAIESLEISADTRVLLPRASLRGKIEHPPGSTQIVLTLQIDGESATRTTHHAPLTLVGFLTTSPDPKINLQPKPEDDGQSETVRAPAQNAGENQ
ncbi:MAG: prepilin-type N-terminal cleavage/methylation domain-containing protein [Rubripirellula sp.]|nr:prepilin-type N-terminal cleavage/methylation domain-containing protein [Rubripirellula sp.]